MPDGKEQWYSNKDLFEQTQKLREELMATNTAITDVIDKKVDSQVKRCDEVQTAAKTKSGIYDRVLQLWRIIISTIIFILSRL